LNPKLAVTATLEAGSDFAAHLERACARSARIIEARVAEPRAEEGPVTAQPTDLRLAPMAVDRRFRR
jgi:hypothetical protein